MKKKDYERIIKKRKRLWDTFTWGYRDEPNRLYKNHSLNCGCSMCTAISAQKKIRNRKERHQFSMERNQIKFDW